LAIKNRTKICPEEKRRPRNHGNWRQRISDRKRKDVHYFRPWVGLQAHIRAVCHFSFILFNPTINGWFVSMELFHSNPFVRELIRLFGILNSASVNMISFQCNINLSINEDLAMRKRDIHGTDRYSRITDQNQGHRVEINLNWKSRVKKCVSDWALEGAVCRSTREN
jgi:hypothetical protein